MTAGDTLQGQRIYPNDEGDLVFSEPGMYGKDEHYGVWFARPPHGSVGSLRNHEITEHEDGTITVSPSILITTHDKNEQTVWHGYLEHGVWREV